MTPQQESAYSTSQAADLIYQMNIAIFFYPFVSLVLTLIFIRFAAPLLGSDAGDLMRMVARIG
jgi:hypothetical protein